VIERCVTFGPGRALVGIVSDPGTDLSRARPAVILLNAGLIHRVGPNRLHVRLARRLAAEGFLAMRVDLSGRGDSDARRDSLSFSESGILETRHAMEHLSSAAGVRRFVLMGICSGATTAGDVAYYDARVAGAAIIEGAAYPTPRFLLRYYRKRLLRWSTWQNTAAGLNGPGRRIRRAFGVRVPAAPEADMSRDGAVAGATSDALAPALTAMVERGVELLAVFSGSTKEYAYAGQLREAFPSVDFGRQLEEAYFPNADHTFTRRRDQDQLIERLMAWMNSRFAAPAAEVVDAGGPEELEQALI
jgi:dienelactone hydrolase